LIFCDAVGVDVAVGESERQELGVVCRMFRGWMIMVFGRKWGQERTVREDEGQNVRRSFMKKKREFVENKSVNNKERSEGKLNEDY
jgi:hypothetical protein